MAVVNKPKVQKHKFGILKKCEVHLHTPASYDYRLTSGKKYTNLSIEEVLELCVKEEFLTFEQSENYFNQTNLHKYENEEYLYLLKDKEIPFDSFKEYLAFMLIAHNLYKEDITLAVISDHNTISGYKKLKFALDEYFKTRLKNSESNKKSIFLMLGVEISCSDKNHVVGIFDDKNFYKVEELINNFIYSIEDGTIETSLTILNKIKLIGGIGYIAHLNSSEFLGTGIYKRQLFNENTLIGSTNLKVMRNIFETKVLPHTNKKVEDFCIIHEGDSHCLEGIGIRNTWIKLNEMSFNSFKKSLTDFRFSVYTEKPEITDKYIKSILIQNSSDGFLRSKDGEEDFYVEFSKDLNCIIGGRGSGKSTLLNLLDTIFSRVSHNKQQLKFLSEHKVIDIDFTYEGDDYNLRFISQLDPKIEYSYTDFFLPKAFLEGDNISDEFILADHWVDLTKISGLHAGPVTGYLKSFILDNVFRKSYSINNIIHRIEKGDIGSFVKEVIFDGIKIIEIESFLMELKIKNQNSIKKYIKDSIPTLKEVMANRKIIVSEKINLFNEINKKQLRLSYGESEKPQHDYLEELLFGINRNKRIQGSLLTWGDVERYLYSIIKKIDFIEFLDLLLYQRFSKLEEILKLASFMKNPSRKSISEIEEEYEEITNENRNIIYRDIIKNLFKNKENVFHSLKKYFAAKDDFNIFFNINSKESQQTNGVLFRPIEVLSLGQKVAAILTFIFKFGLHTNDNTPLIIDQPEDNLDSQYIYKNLVESLKQIKNKRQVIIVTHNPSLVTNAAAEQVIVLASENGRGWVEDQGYHGNAKITKHILQYLEGGEKSFLHKMETYKLILGLGDKY